MSRLAYARAKKERVNVDAMLDLAGLKLTDIENPNASLSAAGQVRFVNLMAQEFADPSLGFQLARDFDLRRLELFYYVPASADTLGDALQRLERYSALVNEGVSIRISKGKSVRLSFHYSGVARHMDSQQIEFFIAAFFRLCRELTGRNFKPIRLRIAHHRNFTKNDLDKFAGVTIETDASMDDITFATQDWNLPIVSTDPYLHQLLVRYCEEALSRRTTKPGPLRVRVENVAASLLPHGQARSDVVARQLGMSPRGLARKLADEGPSFSEILRDLRIALARRYLADHALPISQVAWQLGYKEISAFSNAFRRWTGMTPSMARTLSARSAGR
jgi:AraC-like DNA-binding protein